MGLELEDLQGPIQPKPFFGSELSALHGTIIWAYGISRVTVLRICARAKGGGLKLCQGCLGWILGKKKSLQKSGEALARAAQGRWWSHHPWRCSGIVEMWRWWLVDVVGWVGVGFGDLGDLFQP